MLSFLSRVSLEFSLMSVKLGNKSINNIPELDIFRDSITINSITNTNVINITSSTNVANITFNSNIVISGTNSSLSVIAAGSGSIISFCNSNISTNNGFLKANSNVLNGDITVNINNGMIITHSNLNITNVNSILDVSNGIITSNISYSPTLQISTNSNLILFPKSNLLINSSNTVFQSNVNVLTGIYTPYLNATHINCTTINATTITYNTSTENLYAQYLTSCNLSIYNINSNNGVTVYSSVADNSNYTNALALYYKNTTAGINIYTPKLLIDEYGQIIYNSSNVARGVLDMSYYGHGFDSASNLVYLQGNHNNPLVINSNAYIGIGTQSPSNYIHVDRNNISNSSVNSLIGLYSSLNDISYIQATSNNNLVFDVSKNGNLTIGSNIIPTNKYNIDVSSNIRSPTIFTDTIYSRNQNQEPIPIVSFSNATLNTSNIVTSNLTVTNVLSVQGIEMGGVSFSSSNATVSSTGLFLVQSASNIFTSSSAITTDAQGVPFSVSSEVMKVLSVNSTATSPSVVTTFGQSVQTAVGLNVSAPQTTRGSIRVSSSTTTGSLIELYNYNTSSSYPSQTVFSFAEIGIQSLSSGTPGLYIDYNELQGTNQHGALFLSKYGMRLQNNVQINGTYSDNQSTGISKGGYVGIGLGVSGGNPILAKTMLHVQGDNSGNDVLSVYKYNSSTPSLYCDQYGNVLIGTKTNANNNYVFNVNGTAGFNNIIFSGYISGSINATNVTIGTLPNSTLPSVYSSSTPSTYGSSSFIPSITVDQYGRVISAANNPISQTQWITTGNDIFYTTGNVGVGSSAPKYMLDVTNTSRFENIIGSGSGITNINASNISIGTLSNAQIGVILNTSLPNVYSTVIPTSYGSSALIPTITIDQYGRVISAGTNSISQTQWVSSTNSSIYYSSGNVGIGTTTAPAYRLDVTDTARFANIIGSGTGITNINASNIITGTLQSTLLPPLSSSGTYGTSTAIPQITIDQYGRITAVTLNAISGSGTNPWTGAGSSIYFQTGNVGIGTTTAPAYRLDVTDTARLANIIGSGAGITNINASNIVIGTLQNTSLPNVFSSTVSSTYGSTTNIFSISVDQYGRIVNAANVQSISGSSISYGINASNISTGTLQNISMPNVYSSNGISTYGNATSIISISVDQYGRIVNATNIPGGGGGSSQWTTQQGYGISYASGNVGIGTNKPVYTLDVSNTSSIATARVSGNIIVGSNAAYSFYSTSSISTPNSTIFSSTFSSLNAATNLTSSFMFVNGVNLQYDNSRALKAGNYDGIRAISQWYGYQSINETNAWQSVCWSPQLGLLVSVANSGTKRAMYSNNGTDWYQCTGTGIDSYGWSSVCWSAQLGIYVAVSSTNARVMTSNNGITWTIINVTFSSTWNSICWSSQLGLFVAVGSTGLDRIMYSYNGTSWSYIVTSGITNNWQSICWSPELSLFVAVALNGNGIPSVLYSSIGTGGWIQVQSANDLFQWTSVCWSPQLSLFVAIAKNGGGNTVMYSSNGISWVSATSANDSYNWQSVCWSPELSIFVAISSSASPNCVMYSTNGITWTGLPSANDSNTWQSIIWCPELSLFLSVGSSGTNLIMTSSYAIPASKNSLLVNQNNIYATYSTQNNQNLIIYSGNLGIGSSQPKYALDLLGSARIANIIGSGAAISNINATNIIGSISNTTLPNVYSSSYISTYGNSSTLISISVDQYGRIVNATNIASGGSGSSQWTTQQGYGISYTSGSVGIGSTKPIYTLDITNTGASSIVRVSGNMILGSNAAYSFYSSSTISTPNTTSFSGVYSSLNVATNLSSSVLFVNGINMQYETSRSLKAGSYDGIKAILSWNTNQSSTISNINGVCWSSQLGLFVAVSNSFVITSNNGINWSSQTLNNGGGSWRAICWSSQLGIFLVIGSQNYAISSDGINWTINLLQPYNLSTVYWSPQLGIFVGIGNNNIYYSYNGTTWNLAASGLSIPLVAGNNYSSSLVWSPELEIFVSVNNSVVYYSSIGISNWNSTVDYNNNIYNVWLSIAWSAQLGMFIAVGKNTNASTGIIMYSSNGVNWYGANLPSSGSSSILALNYVCWSAELSIFISVVQNTNSIIYSVNGIVWNYYVINGLNYPLQTIVWSPELSQFLILSNSSPTYILISAFGVPASLNTLLVNPNNISTSYTSQNIQNLVIASGNLGIGSTLPQYLLDLPSGTARIANIIASGAAISNINASNITSGKIQNISLPNVYSSSVSSQYGSVSNSVTITVDQYGRIVSAANISVVLSGAGNAITNIIGSTVSAGINASNVTTGTLPNAVMLQVGSAGSYGTSTAVPTITVDGYGRIINATNTTISLVGSGAAISSLNASNISSGVISNNYLPPNVTFTTITGTNLLVNNLITTSNLSVLGTTTTINSIETISSNLIINNLGAGPGLLVTQIETTNQPVAQFIAGTTQALFINYQGYIGIGTITPGYSLDVNGTGRFTSLIGSGAAISSLNASNVTTGTLATAVLPQIGTAGVYGSTTNIPQITIDSYGRVTSTANNTLSLIGSGAAISNLNASNVTTGTLQNSSLPNVFSSITQISYGSAQNISQISVDQYGRITSATNVGIVTSQWTTVAGYGIYYSSGNVGIGSTQPIYALDVTNTVRTGNVFTTSIGIGTTPTGASGNITLASGGGISAAILGAITINTGGSSSTTGSTGSIISGNIGIGTAAPTTGSAAGSLALAGSIGIGAGVTIPSTPGSIVLATNGNISAAPGGFININTGGNGSTGSTGNVIAGFIGIGTAIPQYSLDVNGTGRFTGTISGKNLPIYPLVMAVAITDEFTPIGTYSASTTFYAPYAFTITSNQYPKFLVSTLPNSGITLTFSISKNGGAATTTTLTTTYQVTSTFTGTFTTADYITISVAVTTGTNTTAVGAKAYIYYS